MVGSLGYTGVCFNLSIMYPKDNIFQIYYNIGKRLPFHVKRSPLGTKGSYDEEYRYSQEGRTFMVESIKIHNRIYGTAYGYLMIDGVRDDKNQYMESYEKGTVPCAGCGEWVLIDVPGHDINEVFPEHKPDFVMPFGKYKGLTLEDVYKRDPKYVYWLADSDRYFRIDFNALAGIDPEKGDVNEQVEKEINRVFPKTTIDDVISFGKYKGKTFKEVFDDDPNYIDWFLRNNRSLDLDIDTFFSYMAEASKDINK